MRFLQLMLVILVYSQIYSCKKKENSNAVLKREGTKLFNDIGCVQCHSLEGEKMYGPPLNSILGNESIVQRMDGKQLKLIVDRAYIYRGIKDPNFEKPLSFLNSIMARPQISEQQINTLTDYIILINMEQ